MSIENRRQLENTRNKLQEMEQLYEKKGGRRLATSTFGS